jgi:hypothetical protein
VSDGQRLRCKPVLHPSLVHGSNGVVLCKRMFEAGRYRQEASGNVVQAVQSRGGQAKVSECAMEGSLAAGRACKGRACYWQRWLRVHTQMWRGTRRSRLSIIALSGLPSIRSQDQLRLHCYA